MKFKLSLVVLFTVILLATGKNAYSLPLSFVEFNFDTSNPDAENIYTFVTPESEQEFKSLFPNQKGFIAFDSSIDYTIRDRNGDGLMDYVTFFSEGTFEGIERFATITFATNSLNGVNLEPNNYFDAQWAPFTDPGHPGLAQSFEGSESSIFDGSFSIQESLFDNSISDPSINKYAKIDKFVANYEIGDVYSGKVFYNYGAQPTVPEPATILLLGGGLAGAIWRRRKVMKV